MPGQYLTPSLGKDFQQGAAWADWCRSKALPAAAWEEDGRWQPTALRGARPGTGLKWTNLGKMRGKICWVWKVGGSASHDLGPQGNWGQRGTTACPLTSGWHAGRVTLGAVPPWAGQPEPL